MENRTPPKAQDVLDDGPPHSRVSTSRPDLMMADSAQYSMDDNADGPRLRMHLSTPKHNFELLASRTVSQAISEQTRPSKLPASPLDSINPSLYPRFPRFSITTESSHPHLSTDEVTSTRISTDEEGIVAARRSPNTSNTRSRKRQILQTTLHRAMSTPTIGLRRLGNRIKQAPSTLLPRRSSKESPRTVSEDQAEDTEEAATSDDTSQSRLSRSSQAVLRRLDMDTQPFSASSTVPLAPLKADYRPTYKLSGLPEYQASDTETAVSHGQRRSLESAGAPSSSIQLPEVDRLRYPIRRPIPTMKRYHLARKHTPQKITTFLGRASSCSNTLGSGVPRSISLGSIDELRSNSFVSTQQRVFSVPIIPSRRSSLAGSTCLTPKRTPRTLSVCNVEDMINLSQLRDVPMFVDIQKGHDVDFIFPSSSSMDTPSISSRRPSVGSKAYSYRAPREKESRTPLLVRSSSIKNGYAEVRGKEKIPLFVPSRIIKPAAGRLTIPERQSSRSSPDTRLRVEDAAQDSHFDRQKNYSKEALSEASDWSTTVQFEAPKQEMFRANPESMLLDPCLEIKQGLGLEGSTSSANRKEIHNNGRPLGTYEAKDTAAGFTGMKESTQHGLGAFERCCVYYQRVKQQLCKGTFANASNI
ncbi:hypothetical protein GJ744_006507 [Endocarpon pusillum]|uniref:Uncharacterized protein n=1 Tax=Endocarpon pusillum TaxID=364733 RepID=A0A8H7AR79_9EURO|nr:hypothetical protein GJ744_006507 [Endocarpon pusillum]